MNIVNQKNAQLISFMRLQQVYVNLAINCNVKLVILITLA